MTAPAVVGAIAGPFRWTVDDVTDANAIAFSLDGSGAPGALIQSELVRNSSVDLLRGAWPSLLHAWRFCHAAWLLKLTDSVRSARARALGCMIANAALPGWSVVNVVFAAFGSIGSYVAIERGRAVVEQGDVLTHYVELTVQGMQELAGRSR